MTKSVCLRCPLQTTRPARWHALRQLFVICAMLLLPAAAMADVVTSWVVVSEAVAPRFGGPQQQARVQAIVQIAVHDALNAIVARYTRYTGPAAMVSGASPDAAVAAASRHAWLELLAPLPDSPLKQAAISTIEAAYTATLGLGPYDAATLKGITVGEAAANAILTRRLGDGSDTPHLPYTLLPGPGVYQPTPNSGVSGRDHAFLRQLGERHTVLSTAQRAVRSGAGDDL